MRKIILLSIAIVLLLVGLFAYPLYQFIKPTNARDNANPTSQREIRNIVLASGPFADLPPTALAISARTDGNAFARIFTLSFISDDAALTAWVRQSPGLQHVPGKTVGDDTVYTLTGKSAETITVTIKRKRHEVTIRMSTS